LQIADCSSGNRLLFEANKSNNKMKNWTKLCFDEQRLKFFISQTLAPHTTYMYNIDRRSWWAVLLIAWGRLYTLIPCSCYTHAHGIESLKTLKVIKIIRTGVSDTHSSQRASGSFECRMGIYEEPCGRRWCSLLSDCIVPYHQSWL